MLPPKKLAEWLIFSWPLGYGYILFGVVLAVGTVIGNKNKLKLPWICWLPVCWLAWQAFATFQTSDRMISVPIFFHFLVCVSLFYLGWHNPMKNRSIILFLVIITISFILVIRIAFGQHFGGLAATRQQFFLYIYPTLKNPPGDLLKRMKSDRVFSTLFYPNTLAAAILLYLPMSIALLLRSKNYLRKAILIGVGACMVLSAALCLFWSGSKTGWLIFMVVILLVIFHSRCERGIKLALVGVFCVAGLAGFFARNKAFFDRGATSVVARTDYWQAAWKIGAKHPVFGTGPGTFGFNYLKIMPSGGEPSKLAHNDYLEQWSDSGLVGFVAFSVFILGSLVVLYRKSTKSIDDFNFWFWLGLLGLSLHSLVEFHLYIPALAWPAFYLFGRQWAVELDRQPGTPSLN